MMEEVRKCVNGTMTSIFIRNCKQTSTDDLNLVRVITYLGCEVDTWRLTSNLCVNDSEDFMHIFFNEWNVTRYTRQQTQRPHSVCLHLDQIHQNHVRLPEPIDLVPAGGYFWWITATKLSGVRGTCPKETALVCQNAHYATKPSAKLPNRQNKPCPQHKIWDVLVFTLDYNWLATIPGLTKISQV